MVSTVQSRAEPINFSSQILKDIRIVKFYKHMYQDVILSGQEDEDWLKSYDRVLEGKADPAVIQEDEILWYEGVR
jgi:hypothetical protein